MTQNSKPIYILGISESHTASATLLKDGEIIASASEERFTRKKLQSGIPKNAIKYCMQSGKITAKDLTCVALADLEPPFLVNKNQIKTLHGLSSFMAYFIDLEKRLEEINPSAKDFFYTIYKTFVSFKIKTRQKKRVKNLSQIISVAADKFKFYPHHLCHASAAFFSSTFPQQNKQALVFTADGVGDFESATLSIFKNNKLKKMISINSQQSLGFFYQHITQYLGLKPIEDEYKVMGLAPYASKHDSQKTYKILSQFFSFDRDKNKWVIRLSELHLFRLLPKILKFQRFDRIANAAQHITEELLLAWVQNSIEKYKITNIVCGGGVFANVKVNKKIAQIKSVKNAFFMPSPGDESNAIGCAYQGYFELTQKPPKPLISLYLGPSFSDNKIEISFKKTKGDFQVQRPRDLNLKVARLLASGEVVARFVGRMEFGARALGNRSILANPKNREVVDFINRAIKNRDFWMPFAPTILRERAHDYLILHKADSPFMNVAYDTIQKGYQDLAAAIHPYDKTARAQILDQGTNPSYYDLIKQFEKLTGIGALLNTSFNLHGEPIVCSPEDALTVFKKSGLKFLIIEKWLISKK